MTKPVTIIGAGVAGLTVALELSLRGVAVEVIERAETVGAQSCAWVAGGMLAPWCELENSEPIIAEMGERSLRWWLEHFPHLVQQRGTLVVAPKRDAAELARYAKLTRNHRLIGEQEIAALEPDLAGRFGKALFFAQEAHLDPRAILPALAARLQERGVEIRYRVDNADCHSGESRNSIVAMDPGFRRGDNEKNELNDGWTLDCRGLAARDALPDLRGVKGEMVIVRSSDIKLSRPVRLLHPRQPVYIVPRGEGRFYIGASIIESEERKTVTARSVMELLNAAYALHPAFADSEIVEISSDLRPAFPDNIPRLVQKGQTLYINGLYRHGFLAAPALAQAAASLICKVQGVENAGESERRSA